MFKKLIILVAAMAVTGTFSNSVTDSVHGVELDPLILTYMPGQEVAEKKPDVDRKISILDHETGEYQVELSIYRKEGQSAAQFIDFIPEGYSLTDVNSHGGRFMFSNRRAVFEWDELPTESSFKISYVLKANSQHENHPVINGILVYGSIQRDKPVPLAPEKSQGPEEVIAQNLIKQEEEKQKSLAAWIPSPQNGLSYKIQISATKRSPPRDEKFFKTSYKMEGVEMTQHEGWNKYLIGNCDSWSAAKEMRLITKNKIPDAFVVAFHNGERIKLEEAFALSKQKFNQ